MPTPKKRTPDPAPAIDADTAAATGAGDPAPDPATTPKADLEAKAADLGLPVEGTKAELADAITDAQITGRPPLAQVGEQLLAEEAERTVVVEIDPDRPDHLKPNQED